MNVRVGVSFSLCVPVSVPVSVCLCIYFGWNDGRRDIHEWVIPHPKSWHTWVSHVMCVYVCAVNYVKADTQTQTETETETETETQEKTQTHPCQVWERHGTAVWVTWLWMSTYYWNSITHPCQIWIRHGTVWVGNMAHMNEILLLDPITYPRQTWVRHGWVGKMTHINEALPLTYRPDPPYK